MNLTVIPLINGVPTGGNGNVSTIDTLMQGLNTNGRVKAANSSPVSESGLQYISIANNASANLLHGLGSGLKGDYLAGLVCVVSTSNSQVQIIDGIQSPITVLPAGITSIGTYNVPLGIFSANGAWAVTTANGVSIIAVGDFT